MAQKADEQKSDKGGPLLYLVLVASLLALVTAGCGVKSGERKPARPAGTETQVFHRSPVVAFEQFRIDLAKTDSEGCTADPANVGVALGQRVRLAIQLPAEIRELSTRSLEVVGEREEVVYEIAGLEVSGSGGSFAPGVKEVNLTLLSGARNSYDFNPVNAGEFDILCDGVKIGTFTVTE